MRALVILVMVVGLAACTGDGAAADAGPATVHDCATDAAPMFCTCIVIDRHCSDPETGEYRLKCCDAADAGH